MKVLIIEDEVQAARDLRASILALQPSFTILDVVDSVEAGLEWFDSHPGPDLIFSDIQLGDGLAFDLLRQAGISCPVVFCTAYDQYAIQAFRHNGIDYLLKPVEEEQLKQCLDKVMQLVQKPAGDTPSPELQALLEAMSSQRPLYKSVFLVAWREKLIPVHVEQVSFFRIAGNTVELFTRDQHAYRLPESLDQIESMVNPSLFYRVNRQFLVHFSAIREVELYFDRKLLVKLVHVFPDPIIISKAKATPFLQWMANR